ncbi:hypothetical protein B0H16DRAFT_504230 [Mycena metata]|uniref:Uncharacterized protein n=1 Tax=Mycena metata TaxID=1033252 RepID=A0AAD7JEX1_9AGAR|nr:hypothetical protein B0H16DRAFT_504230 [Mycena metata]
MSLLHKAYAVFTEDASATQSIVCGRIACGRAIMPGEPRHSMGNQNANGLSKIVCGECRTHYLGLPTTIRRKNVAEATVVTASAAQDIRRSVNNARNRGATNSERRVTPIPAHQLEGGPSSGPFYSPVMPPPGFPRVAIPSSWGGASNFAPPGSQHSGYGSAKGYSDAHQHYPAQRELWAKKAYSGSPGETISIIMQVLHDIPGKFKKGAVVQNLSEGKSIPANSTPPYIIHVVMSIMKPLLANTTEGFKFNWTHLVVRDVHSWTNLAQEDKNHPYYYDRCLVTPSTKSKDRTKVFKRPKNPFFVALVIPFDQWDQYLTYAETVDVETEKQALSSRATATGRANSGVRSCRTTDSAWEDGVLKDSLESSDLELSAANKRQRRSTSISAPSTPPPSKKRIVPPEYVSPDRSKVWQALAIGGSSAIVHTPMTSERVEFFPLAECDLHKLLQSTEFSGGQFLTCDAQYAAQGSLTVEFRTSLGHGTFKTAHLGHLSLIHLPAQGLGRTRNTRVAAKRLYRSRSEKEGSPSDLIVRRFPAADEYARTLREANLLFWGVSIMTFTYSFINHFATQTDKELPFDIPSLRFVHAGVAVSHDHVTGNNIANTTSIRRTYILEELIDTDDSNEFVKYIHSGSAAPHLQPDDPLYDIAQFSHNMSNITKLEAQSFSPTYKVQKLYLQIRKS